MSVHQNYSQIAKIWGKFVRALQCNKYHETKVRPVVDEVSIRVDGVRLRQVFLNQPHNFRHLKLRLVHDVGDVFFTVDVSRRRRRRHV